MNRPMRKGGSPSRRSRPIASKRRVRRESRWGTRRIRWVPGGRGAPATGGGAEAVGLFRAIAGDVEGRIVERGRAGAEEELGRVALTADERRIWMLLGGFGMTGLVFALMEVI